ncbi:hypothetical protein [Teichococcus aestuarii]|uniref:hypothetical protein n=1 Tax=Teichococcus aestuarii TaxID=568898 RepID=UPI0036117423
MAADLDRDLAARGLLQPVPQDRQVDGGVLRVGRHRLRHGGDAELQPGRQRRLCLGGMQQSQGGRGRPPASKVLNMIAEPLFF